MRIRIPFSLTGIIFTIVLFYLNLQFFPLFAFIYLTIKLACWNIEFLVANHIFEKDHSPFEGEPRTFSLEIGKYTKAENE